jgi:hypothetical protein
MRKQQERQNRFESSDPHFRGADIRYRIAIEEGDSAKEADDRAKEAGELALSTYMNSRGRDYTVKFPGAERLSDSLPNSLPVKIEDLSEASQPIEVSHQ